MILIALLFLIGVGLTWRLHQRGRQINTRENLDLPARPLPPWRPGRAHVTWRHR